MSGLDERLLPPGFQRSRRPLRRSEAQRWGLAVLILSALCVFVLLTQGARANGLAAGSAVSCPSAPSGWTTAPTNPKVWGPAQNPGQDTEVVTCTYSDGTKIASIVSNFALPIDPNPF